LLPAAPDPGNEAHRALSYAEGTHPLAGPGPPANRGERRAFSPPADEFSAEHERPAT